MTSTLAHGVGRSPGEPVRRLRVLAWSPALIVLLLGGLALRLTIAYVLFPSSGFTTDVSSYASWAMTLAEHGPGGFYASAGFADYPPAYLYLLWPVGLLARGASDPGAMAADLVKLPPILLDLAVGYVLYRLVRGWAWPSRRAEAMALGAAALYLFNPVSFYDSALWGQSDAAGALMLLLGAAALVRGNSEGAAALAAVAALVKPQFGVVLLPLVAFVLIKRHLVLPGSGPQRAAWAPAPLAGWLARQQGPLRLLTAAATALVAFLVVALPFGMGPLEYLDRMVGTAAGYSYLSVNAFNAWALFGSGGVAPLAQALGWSDDTVGLLGPIPGVTIGAALLVGGFLWGCWRGAVRDDRWTLLMALAFLAIAFFILPTRVHERYIFPAVAILPLLAVVSRRWSLALLLLSVGAFINLHAILTVPLYGSENVTSLPLGAWFRTTPLVAASAILQTAVGLWAAWQLRPALRTSPDGYDLAAAAVLAAAGSVAPGAAGWPPGLVGPLGTPVGAVAATAGPSSATTRPWVRGPGAIDWLIDRLSRPSVRADRSGSLAGEPGGRIDRRDLLIVSGLVLVTLLLRGYRLGEPVRMHFDEVYHARTATEFLQDWEYGQPHAIYEFTHPHLAKYAMAWGIRLAGGNSVHGTANLGASVADATIERAWSATDDTRADAGDRLYVATGSSLRVYDIASLELLRELPLAATAVAVDEDAHALYVAGLGGELFRLETTALEGPPAEDQDEAAVPVPFSAGPGAPVQQLLVTDRSLVAIDASSVSTFDLETGLPLSDRFAFDASDAVALPQASRVVVDTRALSDPAQVAYVLAQALASPPAEDGVADASVADVSAEPSARPSVEPDAEDVKRLEALFGTKDLVVTDAYLSADAEERVQAAIEAGTLPGVEVSSGTLLALSDHRGISILDARTLDPVAEVSAGQAVTGMDLVTDGLEKPTLYAAAGTDLLITAIDETGPGLPTTLEMPGAVSDVAWNEPANLIHVLGEAPEGGPTVYVVEPHGNAVFADVPLPMAPTRLLADTQPERPAQDRGELLALAGDGSLARIGIAGNTFGWRLPGMLLGCLLAALLYLLARVLFARRSIALLTGALVAAEGMLFVNARIAMNDIYVTTFIVAAALLFALIYLRPRRPWTVTATLLAMGLALGLALASKWVAVYALGGFLLLILFRSGLGRLLALLGMVGVTAVLGALAVRPPPIEDPARNWTFVFLMLALTGLLAAAMVRRPLPITRGEVRLATLAPIVLGVAALLVGLLVGSRRAMLLAVGAIAVGLLVGAVAALAGRHGRGPLAPVAASGLGGADAAPSPIAIEPHSANTGGAWLQPGRLAGLPWLFALACLTLLPAAVYIISYAPWVSLGNSWGLPAIGSLPFMPAGGDAGQTLADLTRSMYEYHDNLRATHAASSPWWAWPLDLKPVWFFSDHYAGSSTALIYDAGNVVVFWMGLAGMAFSSWAAWHRRSRSLAIVLILAAVLWLPWARIDRATFQYHVFASLPFGVLALAYFLAELWHGPGVRAWFLARASAALAIVAAPVAWFVLRIPLCMLAGTSEVQEGSAACAAQVTRTAQLSQGGGAALAAVVVGAATAGLLVYRGRRRVTRAVAGTSRRSPAAAAMAWPVVVGLLTLGAVAAAMLFLDTTTTTAITLTSDMVALVALVILAIPAWLVLRARDPRRFVLGVLAAAVLWLVLFYPDISGLPMPSAIAEVYQRLFPTWDWSFQFAVNLDPPTVGGFVDLATIVTGAVALAVAIVAMAAARRWRRGTPPA